VGIWAQKKNKKIRAKRKRFARTPNYMPKMHGRHRKRGPRLHTANTAYVNMNLGLIGMRPDGFGGSES
jgi:hypothetical protein